MKTEKHAEGVCRDAWGVTVPLLPVTGGSEAWAPN